MVGKVEHFDSVVEPHTLATHLIERYTMYANQRRSKIEETKELRNYIFATDTTTTTNSELPWKNSTTLPKICQIRDNLHANYMAALFSNDQWFKWEAHSEESSDKAKAQAIEAYMSNKLREGGFQEIVSRMLYDYIDYGNVFADTEFVSENKEDPETGEVIPGYIGPKAVRISPYDIVFNPAAKDFASSVKFVRYVKSIGELMAEVDSRPELQYNKDILQKIMDVRKELSTYEQSDWDKAEGYIADGFGSLQEYYGSGLVEIIEAVGDFYDEDEDKLYKDHIVTVIDRTHVIRRVPNPRWLGGSSIVHCGWRLRPDNLYAMGPLDNLVGLQYRIDHLENLKADVFDLIAHPPIVIKGDVEDFDWGPFEQIDVGEDGDVSLLNIDATALNADMQIANIMQVMEEMAGAPKEAMGIRSPGEKTAFEVQQLQNAAGRIFQQKITYFEQNIVEPLLNNMLEQARRNMEAADIIRVMDDDLGVVDFIKVSKEDITAKGKLRPVGARHFAAQAQLVQNLTGVFTSPVGQMIMPHVSSKKMAKLVEEVFGLEKFDLFGDNIAVMEQAETQRLMNSAQEQVNTEAITPDEEDNAEQP